MMDSTSASAQQPQQQPQARHFLFWAKGNVVTELRLRMVGNGGLLALDFLIDGREVPVPLGVSVEMVDPYTQVPIEILPQQRYGGRIFIFDFRGEFEVSYFGVNLLGSPIKQEEGRRRGASF